MSRSRKKEPIIKDKGSQKEIYNRKFRRVCKQVNIEDDTIFPNSRELTNDYNICDWKFDARDYRSEEKVKNFKRK